jgi:hypothetical protein
MLYLLYFQALYESKQYSTVEAKEGSLCISAAESCLPSLQSFLWSTNPTFLCLHELTSGSILSRKESVLALTSISFEHNLVLSSHLDA